MQLDYIHHMIREFIFACITTLIDAYIFSAIHWVLEYLIWFLVVCRILMQCTMCLYMYYKNSTYVLCPLVQWMGTNMCGWKFLLLWQQKLTQAMYIWEWKQIWCTMSELPIGHSAGRTHLWFWKYSYKLPWSEFPYKSKISSNGGASSEKSCVLGQENMALIGS